MEWWDKNCISKKWDHLIEFKIDSLQAKRDGEKVQLDSPAKILESRTFITKKSIKKLTQREINWDEDFKVLLIGNIKQDSHEESLTYSNLVDKKTQEEVRKTMGKSGILKENLNLFFEEVNEFNRIVENKSLVESGFTTINSLEPEYDLYIMDELWDKESLYFIGYNCRIVSYDLMKDSIKIGNIDTKNNSNLIFDIHAIETNPKDIFNGREREEFETLFSFIPTEETQDIEVHLEKVKQDWKEKEIEFLNEDKRTLISVLFHDEYGYLFIGHMGVLIPEEDGSLLFIEKITFKAPYQAVRFNNRQELNDYLMNKYDISWGQPTAKPFIMENDELLKEYRENPNNIREK